MAKKLEITRLRKKYQITLPESILERLQLQEGDVIVFFEKDGDIAMRKVVINRNFTAS